MATPYPGPVSAVQVGSYFVGQYYQILQQQPELVHQFYSDSSTMIRVDGDSSNSASAMLQIHTLIMSFHFSAIEIKTINSLESWNGGVLVLVSGSIKIKDYGMRKFVQTFFLAPQDKGYFVLNDIFQLLADEMIYQHPAPTLPEDKLDTHVDASSPIPEPPVSDYVLEEDVRDYVNSVHIEDDTVDKYSLSEQQQQYDLEAEIVVDETPAEEPPASLPSVVNTVQEPPAAAVEEPVGEPLKKTYASILQVTKGQIASSVATQTSFNKGTSATSEWNYTSQPATYQSNSALPYAPESGVIAAEEGLTVEKEGAVTLQENQVDSYILSGELKSVYVRNLPSTVTATEIEEEFKNFGRIKPEGVFIRSVKDTDACYAFVEFEDMLGVQNAIMASPIQLAGRQVYIEERRANSSSTRGGRPGRGRGRGSYQTDAPRGRFGSRSLGRGSNQDGGDYNRPRGNGFHQRGSR